jgi:NitT/TauT family transport system substrate-binding protein
MKAMARLVGIDPASIQFLAVGPEAPAMAALKSGRIDAYSHFIGVIAGLENLGMKFRASPDVPSGVFVTSDALLARTAISWCAACEASRSAARLAQVNPIAAARNYYAQFQAPAGDPPKLFATTCTRSRRRFRSSSSRTTAINGVR